VHKAVGCCSL